MPLQRPTTRVCHALLQFPAQSVPACNAEVSHTQWPLLHHVVQAVHKEGHTERSHRQEPSPLNRAWHTAHSRSIPDTWWHMLSWGSTPKIRSLADLSMTSHITWRNPTVSTSPTLLKPQHRSSPWSSHILSDGRPNSLTKTQAKLNITKMERLVRLSWLHG
jgi:hypothetical protein